MSDPYIPAGDRIDVIGRLTARLDDDGQQTLRQQAAAEAEEELGKPDEEFGKDPGVFEKPTKEVEKEEKENKDIKEAKEEKEETKDGDKDFKDTKEDDEKAEPFDEPKAPEPEYQDRSRPVM
jgi:hypothetical protein